MERACWQSPTLLKPCLRRLASAGAAQDLIALQEVMITALGFLFFNICRELVLIYSSNLLIAEFSTRVDNGDSGYGQSISVTANEAGERLPSVPATTSSTPYSLLTAATSKYVAIVHYNFKAHGKLFRSNMLSRR